MSAEPYTPDEVELIGCYAGAMEEQAGEDYATAKADAERGIAKIKADALREAANDLAVKLQTLWGGREKLFVEVDRLHERADRIEGET